MDEQDNNRLFADPVAESAVSVGVQQHIDERVYLAITGIANAVIGLHTATVGSMSFVIRDRVLHGTHRSGAETTMLTTQLESLIDPFGHPSVTEYRAVEYLEESLQRSMAGTVLNTAGISAFTAELGGHSVVTEQLRAGGVARTHAVARKLGILSSLLEGVDTHSETISNSLVYFRIRRNRDTRADTAGLVRYRFDAGEVFGKGDPLVNVVFPTDNHLKTGTADRDSYVIGQAERLASHEGDPVASTAIRGETDLVVVRDD